MKKVLTISVLLITLLGCKKSDKEILVKTILVLDNIEKVKYQSNLQAKEGGTTFLDQTDTIFFDFDGIMKDSTPRYFFKSSSGELIFDGMTHIQSLSEENVILTEDAPNANNPLMITLFPIKVFLPKLMDNKDVTIVQREDSLIEEKNSYVFDFTVKKGYLDWENLEIKSGAGSDTKYTLTINKSDFLPTKFLMQNGESGTFSRTLEGFDFKYAPSENLWTGSLLPQDYPKMTFGEYHSIQQANFKKLQERSSSVSDIKLNQMELPNLDNDSKVNFSKHKGDLVLLEFWFKYCGPCVQAVPRLNAIHEKYKDQNFALYGIEFKQEFDKENLQEYVKKIKMDYPSLYQGKKLAADLGVSAAPSFIIMDKKGDIIYVESGFNEKEIIKIITENL